VRPYVRCQVSSYEVDRIAEIPIIVLLMIGSFKEINIELNLVTTKMLFVVRYKTFGEIREIKYATLQEAVEFYNSLTREGMKK
jgi:hypothetical protein